MARLASSNADTAAPSCNRSEVPNAKLYSIDANRSTKSTRAIGGMLSFKAHLFVTTTQNSVQGWPGAGDRIWLDDHT